MAGHPRPKRCNAGTYTVKVVDGEATFGHSHLDRRPSAAGNALADSTGRHTGYPVQTLSNTLWPVNRPKANQRLLKIVRRRTTHSGPKSIHRSTAVASPLSPIPKRYLGTFLPQPPQHVMGPRTEHGVCGAETSWATTHVLRCISPTWGMPAPLLVPKLRLGMQSPKFCFAIARRPIRWRGVPTANNGTGPPVDIAVAQFRGHFNIGSLPLLTNMGAYPSSFNS